MSSTVDIAASLASAARTIDANRNREDILDAIAAGAKASVPGIEHAGITTVDRHGRIQTRAATDDVVTALDDLQYELGEGPCLDALRLSRIVAAPRIAQDQRWPRYVRDAVAVHGLRAQLAVQLFLDEEGTLGGLNLYSLESEDLDEDAIEVAELFAAHAAIALGRAREVSGLEVAMETRKLIGQALGIVMERYTLDESHAFAFLARASSHSNVKLRDVAAELVAQATRRHAHHVNDTASAN